MIYQHPSLQLTETGLIDEFGTITLEDLPTHEGEIPFGLKKPTPFLNKLWRCALFDFKSNLVSCEDGTYLAAGGRGKGWNGIIFPRDLAYSGILGLDALFPDVMWGCLQISRKARLNTGMWVNQNHYHPDLPFRLMDASQQPPEKSNRTHTTARGTDDVLWLWWAEDLFVRHSNYSSSENWQWLYETGIRCFQEIYDHFYDEETGLYRGQCTFVDIADNGYPPSFGRDTIEAKRNCLMIRPTSTNCLYYKGFVVMAKAARKLGLHDEASGWEQRANHLKRAIRTQLLLPEGTLSYFMHEDGHLEPRQHCLATALAILLDVIEGDDAIKAIEHYPVTWWGVPLLHPFYAEGSCHHNNTAWPFCDAFFLRAREKALGIDETERELALLARTCRGGTFREYTSALNKGPVGKEAQLWTLAPLLGSCHAKGWVSSIPVDKD